MKYQNLERLSAAAAALALITCASAVATAQTPSADFQVEQMQDTIAEFDKTFGEGKVIGIPKEYRMEGMPGEIETLWADGRRMLADAGARIVDISLPQRAETAVRTRTSPGFGTGRGTSATATDALPQSLSCFIVTSLL